MSRLVPHPDPIDATAKSPYRAEVPCQGRRYRRFANADLCVRLVSKDHQYVHLTTRISPALILLVTALYGENFGPEWTVWL
jgi:hypothetical protein